MSNDHLEVSTSKFVGDESDGAITAGPGFIEPLVRQAVIDFPVHELAALYQERLSTEPLANKFAHHISHVASEGWLGLELAFLVNTEGENVGLADWHARLERGRVDVTLINQITGDNIYLELKLVPPDWWKSNWKDIYKDLGYSVQGPITTAKPRADYAVCFTFYPDEWSSALKSSTVELYKKYLNAVPLTPGTFVPYGDMPALQVVADSEPFPLKWSRPTGESVYDSICRIWWVRLADIVPVT